MVARPTPEHLKKELHGPLSEGDRERERELRNDTDCTHSFNSGSETVAPEAIGIRSRKKGFLLDRGPTPNQHLPCSDTAQTNIMMVSILMISKSHNPSKPSTSSSNGKNSRPDPLSYLHAPTPPSALGNVSPN